MDTFAPLLFAEKSMQLFQFVSLCVFASKLRQHLLHKRQHKIAFLPRVTLLEYLISSKQSFQRKRCHLLIWSKFMFHVLLASLS